MSGVKIGGIESERLAQYERLWDIEHGEFPTYINKEGVIYLRMSLENADWLAARIAALEAQAVRDRAVVEAVRRWKLALSHV